MLLSAVRTYLHFDALWKCSGLVSPVLGNELVVRSKYYIYMYHYYRTAHCPMKSFNIRATVTAQDIIIVPS